LLAAGEGSRFGQPKALVELDGQTLAERGIDMLLAGGADPVLVVTGAAQIELDPKTPRDPKAPKDPKTPKGAQAPGHEIHTVYNGEWRTGRGSSLCAALRALSQAGEPDAAERSAAVLPQDVAAVVVALADQPLVGAEAVARLIAAHRAGASVAVAAYDGQPRNPVLLAREHWPEVIATATGDQGARAFLRARPDLVTLIECGDTGRPDDIDTTADLERIAGHRRGPEPVP
jgi:nicotine blue oxidoreductase